MMIEVNRVSQKKVTLSRISAARLIILVLLTNLAGVAGAASEPQAPTIFDVPYAAPSGKTISVVAGGDLQDAFNRAMPGDTIVLQAGSVYTGPFRLPYKSGAGWIYVQSSAYMALPEPMRRVVPDDAPNMPKIEVGAGRGAAIVTDLNAHHYRFVGIEIRPQRGQYVNALVQIGSADSSPDTLPSNIVFDRCYVHGDPAVGGRRGIAMDGRYIAVVDSYIADFKEVGADSQALWAYNTSGPIKIVNNYLEAAGENVMFGGADSKSESLVPADIEIRGNWFFKPLTWQGSTWTIKNLLEFKAARRALVTGNRFENVWPAAQAGYALLITPRNQSGNAPWSVVQDIDVVSNHWIGVSNGFNVLGYDNLEPSQRTGRVRLANNLAIISSLSTSAGRAFLMTGGPLDVAVQHNTFINTGTMAITDAQSSPKAERFVFRDNIALRGYYGFFGSAVGEGNAALSAYYSNWAFEGNAIVGAPPSVYPDGNYFPKTISDVKFVDAPAGDYRLATTSPYKRAATDSRDVGVDVDALAVAMGTSMAVAPSPPSNIRVQ